MIFFLFSPLYGKMEEKVKDPVYIGIRAFLWGVVLNMVFNHLGEAT